MTTKEFFQSSGYNKLIISLGSLLAFLVIFAAGMAVGYREAAFSYHWQSNYGPGFSDPSSPFAPFIHDGDDINPHGAFGTIVSFKSPYLIVKGVKSGREHHHHRLKHPRHQAHPRFRHYHRPYAGPAGHHHRHTG